MNKNDSAVIRTFLPLWFTSNVTSLDLIRSLIWSCELCSWLWQIKLIGTYGNKFRLWIVTLSWKRCLPLHASTSSCELQMNVVESGGWIWRSQTVCMARPHFFGRQLWWTVLADYLCKANHGQRHTPETRHPVSNKTVILCLGSLVRLIVKCSKSHLNIWICRRSNHLQTADLLIVEMFRLIMLQGCSRG